MEGAEALGFLAAATAMVPLGLPAIAEHKRLSDHLGYIQKLTTLAMEKVELLELELKGLEKDIAGGRIPPSSICRSLGAKPGATCSLRTNNDGSSCCKQRNILVGKEIQYCHGFLIRARQFLEWLRKLDRIHCRLEEEQEGADTGEKRGEDEYPSPISMNFVRLQPCSSRRRNPRYPPADHRPIFDLHGMRNGLKLACTCTGTLQGQNNVGLKCQRLQHITAQTVGLRAKLQELRHGYCGCNYGNGLFYDPYNFPFAKILETRDAATIAMPTFIASISRTAGSAFIPWSQSVDLDRVIINHNRVTRNDVAFEPACPTRKVLPANHDLWHVFHSVRPLMYIINGKEYGAPEHLKNIPPKKLRSLNPRPPVYIVNGKECGWGRHIEFPKKDRLLFPHPLAYTVNGKKCGPLLPSSHNLSPNWIILTQQSTIAQGQVVLGSSPCVNIH